MTRSSTSLSIIASIALTGCLFTNQQNNGTTDAGGGGSVDAGGGGSDTGSGEGDAGAPDLGSPEDMGSVEPDQGFCPLLELGNCSARDRIEGVLLTNDCGAEIDCSAGSGQLIHPTLFVGLNSRGETGPDVIEGYPLGIELDPPFVPLGDDEDPLCGEDTPRWYEEGGVLAHYNTIYDFERDRWSIYPINPQRGNDPRSITLACVDPLDPDDYDDDLILWETDFDLSVLLPGRIDPDDEPVPAMWLRVDSLSDNWNTWASDTPERSRWEPYSEPAGGSPRIIASNNGPFELLSFNTQADFGQDNYHGLILQGSNGSPRTLELSEQHTIIVVARRLTNATGNDILFNDGLNQLRFTNESDGTVSINGIMGRQREAPRVIRGVPDVDPSNLRVYGFIRDGADAYLYQDDVELSRSDEFEGLPGFGLRDIGMFRNTTLEEHGFQGAIGEVIVYDDALTEEEYQRLVTYLFVKFQLPGDP